MPSWNPPDKSFRLDYLDEGNGQTLVLLHAFPLTSEMWRPQFDQFARHYRVIAPDTFGFGGSTLPAGGWTIDDMADAVMDLLESLVVSDRVIVGGLSMGGYIAMAFARRHPIHLRGLILADTRSSADNDEAKAGREQSISFVQQHGPAAFFEQKMLPKMISDTTRAKLPNLPMELLRLASAQTQDGVAAGLTALKNRPDATPSLSAIEVPSLVVCGSEDVITPHAYSEQIVANIPHVRLDMIPGAGHLSSLEAPEVFNEVVSNYLASLS